MKLAFTSAAINISTPDYNQDFLETQNIISNKLQAAIPMAIGSKLSARLNIGQAAKSRSFTGFLFAACLMLGLFAFNNNANAATYYLTAAGAGAAQTPGNWNTIPAGGGTAATNFITLTAIVNVTPVVIVKVPSI